MNDLVGKIDPVRPKAAERVFSTALLSNTETDLVPIDNDKSFHLEPNQSLAKRLSKSLHISKSNIGHRTSIRPHSLFSRHTRGSPYISNMAAREDLVHGWVSTDCGRGTSDILWSCLATILLSVWTVIHLPVPCCSRFEKGNLISGEPSQSWRNWVIRSGIVPAVISVIAPEFMAYMAMGDLYAAWLIQRQMKQMKWTLTHAFFLHMGGFCLETPSGLRMQFDVNQLLSAIANSADWLRQLEKVEEHHINDHAKSNPITKFIACGQALWLVTQIISRVHQHKAVTLLEVSTTAYAVCALTAYLAWWNKPQNPTLPITISCSDEELPQQQKTNLMYYDFESKEEYVWAGRDWFNDVFRIKGSSYPRVITFLGILCTAIFGVIHVTSWNIKLLSHAEQWLWRGSALYCCTAGTIFVLVPALVAICQDLSLIREDISYIIATYALVVIASIYAIVRLYMIAEVFLSLRALPRSAYEEVQWSSFIPHI